MDFDQHFVMSNCVTLKIIINYQYLAHSRSSINAHGNIGVLCAVAMVIITSQTGTHSIAMGFGSSC